VVDPATGYSTDSTDTCLCEQDPKQQPGMCHTWLKPNFDKSCRSRRCEKSWKCSESQVPPASGKAPVCKRVKVTESIRPSGVVGFCVGQPVDRYVWIRIEV
jgi:hypothetical protein